MQSTAIGQAEWEADLATYLQEEDPDSFAVSGRVAVSQFVDDLLESYGWLRRKGRTPDDRKVELRTPDSLCSPVQRSSPLRVDSRKALSPLLQVS